MQSGAPDASPLCSPTADFVSRRINASIARRSLSPDRDRMLATAFRSPATVSALTDSIPGSTLLALPLRFPADRFRCPFGPSLRYRSPVCSGDRQHRRSWPVAASAPASACRLPGLHSPPGQLRPSGSKRSAGSAASWPAFRRSPIPVRSPPPTSIASRRLRINVPGPLLLRRLAVPQTSWNLLHYAPDPEIRQR
jgi:hypothetical protein